MRRVFSFLRELDGWLILGVGVLLLFGFVAIWSVDISRGTNAVLKQVGAVATGGVLLFTGAFSHPRFFHRYRYIFLGAGVLLMASVLVFGHSINGTRGWFRFLGFTFQPVEFAKFVLLISLASILPLHARVRSVRAMVGASVVTAVFIFLTMLQPDLGSAMLLIGLWGAMILVSGVPRRYVALLFIAAVLVAGGAWKFGFAPYQRERILTFLDPSRDPQGRGYNVSQAQIAVGSGGWFGRGFGSGTQSQLRFLPESQTDFIFSVVAEEFGLWAVVALIGSFGLIVVRLYRLAHNAPDDFSQFIVIGSAMLITVEAFVAIGGNIGLIPVTGITLPFVSSGGSSMLMHLALVGLLLSIHRASVRGAPLRKAVWDETQS